MTFFHWKWAEGGVDPSGGWIRFRLCGWRGVWFATYRGWAKSFSERDGKTKVLRLGRWARARLLGPPLVFRAARRQAA